MRLNRKDREVISVGRLMCYGLIFGVVMMVFMVMLAPQSNTKTYTHVAVVADALDGPGTALEWRIESDTLWIFLR